MSMNVKMAMLVAAKDDVRLTFELARSSPTRVPPFCMRQPMKRTPGKTGGVDAPEVKALDGRSPQMPPSKERGDGDERHHGADDKDGAEPGYCGDLARDERAGDDAEVGKGQIGRASV